jgi:hypothetical protein
MTKFISKPNDCGGCPLKDAPLKFKLSSLCHKWKPGYIVDNRLDNLGREICEVEEIEIRG